MKYDWKAMKEGYSKIAEFRNWFQNNFVRIINESEELSASDIGFFYRNDEMKEIILQNLDLVLSKIKSKSEFLQFMTMSEKKRNFDKLARAWPRSGSDL